MSDTIAQTSDMIPEKEFEVGLQVKLELIKVTIDSYTKKLPRLAGWLSGDYEQGYNCTICDKEIVPVELAAVDSLIIIEHFRNMHEDIFTLISI